MSALRVAAMVTLGVLAAGRVAAQEETRGPISLRVMVVHAAEQKGAIDPQLRRLPRSLGPMKFGTLRLIEQQQLSLGMGQEGHVALPAGREVMMVPLSVVQRRLFMHLEMPGQVNGQLRMVPGRPVVLGGQRHGDGHVIVYIEPEF
jgi:hypothetical protein